MSDINLTELTRKGQTRQFSNSNISKIILNPQRKYRIGFSLAQKKYMELGDPKQDKQFQMQMVFLGSKGDSITHIIEIGKTQKYETEISNLKEIIFLRGFPSGLIFEVTCLGGDI